jgi:hypothetical protein
MDSFDMWNYFLDEDIGVGIVVNHFRDDGNPEVNVYVVPEDKVANNRWHDDMQELQQVPTLRSSMQIALRRRGG